MKRWFPLALAGMVALTAPAYADNISWSYDGDQNGQEDWGSLSQAYAACSVGTAQSPIALSGAQTVSLPALTMKYTASPAHSQRKDYTLAVAIDGKNILIDKGQQYLLRELRMHSPSEHMIGDMFFPLELHFIHQDASGKTLILAVFVKGGGLDNPNFQSVLTNAPQPGEVKNFTLDMIGLLPVARGYYSYTGSLSAPPCTEGVEWRVLKTSISISDAQIKEITKLLGRNARLTQPIYMRSLQQTSD